LKNECIILITKNRPETVKITIGQIAEIGLKVILIDDSTTSGTKDMVLTQFKKNNLIYHGKAEQNIFLKKLKKIDLNDFLRPLGTRSWNLGFVRNYALILSKVLGCDRILFMDDDIIIQNVSVIKKMMDKLDYVDFVGAKVTGMADDSVVGHLMRSCGGEYYEFLAGGFLAFNMSVISEYFLNHYNEDQIWLFLHPPATKFETYEKVEQQSFDPFFNASEKALSQEFGEILDDGAEEAFNRGNSNLLITQDFWEGICNIRINYLKQLKDLSTGKKTEPIALNVYKVLIDYHSRISYNAFVQVFVEYFGRREKWREIFHSMDVSYLKYLEA